MSFYSPSNYGQQLAVTTLTYEGGLPFSRDLAPAIIFSILYGLTIPILGWRLFSARHRSGILYNAVGHWLFRWIAMVMRAYMSRNPYSYRLFLAETVLLTISWLFLVNALVDLMQRHGHIHRENINAISTATTTSRFGNANGGHAVESAHRDAKWVTAFSYALRFNLIVSLILIIASVGLYSDKLENASRLQTARRLARASYIIGLVVAALATFATLAIHFMYRRFTRKTGYILAFAVPLWVSSIYRVTNSFLLYNTTDRQLAAFWVALITMEFIAYVLLHAVSLPEWFGSTGERVNRRDSDLEKTAVHRNNSFKSPRPSTATDGTTLGPRTEVRH